jgi:hypothetical protein
MIRDLTISFDPLLRFHDFPVKVGNPHFSGAQFQIAQPLQRGTAMGLSILDITTGDDPEEFFGTVDDLWSPGILHPQLL